MQIEAFEGSLNCLIGLYWCCCLYFPSVLISRTITLCETCIVFWSWRYCCDSSVLDVLDHLHYNRSVIYIMALPTVGKLYMWKEH